MVEISEIANKSHSAVPQADPDQNPPLRDPNQILPIINPNPNQTPHNDDAFHGPAAAPADDRCKAMLEVVQKDSGKWKISKLVANHNHPMDSGASSRELPDTETEFDSVEAAKEFYYGYAERAGFKALAGSNRRAAGTWALIMQRFMCSRGSYAKSRKLKKLVVEAESARENGNGDKEGEDWVKDDRAEEGEGGPKAKKTRCAGKERKDALSPHPLLKYCKMTKYTDEERRDALLKYMAKRNSRQNIERPAKISSQQTVAERCERDVDGRFSSRDDSEIGLRLIAPRPIAPWPVVPRPIVPDGHQGDVGKSSLIRDEMQTLISRQEETEAEFGGLTDDAYTGEEPKVGMEFANENKAFKFYCNYAIHVGFSVRKGWWERSGRKVTTRVYVCSKEGFRPRSAKIKRQKNDPRTCCPARMSIKITPSGNYCVNEFVADHNHELALPFGIKMLKSQTLATKLHPGGLQNVSLVPYDCKNYLRVKRTKDMQMGDAGAMLEYLQKMKGDEPSFFYAIQVDVDGQLTNFFWADGRNIMDYYYFGDVVCFDMSYKANDHRRPFASFIGVNHHKQAVIFGAALLYDESLESFKWLFETFKSVMCGKQPKTFFSDQCTEIADAIAAVWPGTNYLPCVWHIFQNATKELNYVIQASETFMPDFCHCVYDCEVEEEFLSAWEVMLEKYDLKENEWLAKLYNKKEKWALVYNRVFSADIQNTLRNESLNSMLKKCLSSEVDLLRLFEKYKQLVDERRYEEQQADYDATQVMLKIPPSRLMWQAANIYTPAVFEIFRAEFGLSMNCTVYNCGEVGTKSEYVVLIKECTREHLVKFDSSDCSISCNCKKFESIGVLCCHVLKVLVFKNIEELPAQYILKRWGKNAKMGFSIENQEPVVDGDPKSSTPKRYSSLCRILYKIATRASENVEAIAFMENQLDQLLEQVEQIQNQVYSESVQHDSNSDSQRAREKKKDGASHRRHQSGMEMNKKQKRRKGQFDKGPGSPRTNEPLVESDEVLSNMRNPSDQFFTPSQFMQIQREQYVSGHQFELNSIQDFHGVAQYNQEPSTSALQQQPFTARSHLGQVCAAPETHPAQFVTSNPQPDQPSNAQGHYSTPVWDFL